MFKNYKLAGVGFLWFWVFALISFQPYFQIIETAWSETGAVTDNQDSDPVIEDSQPWGAFRGWSPSIPYGKTSSDQTNRLDLANDPPVDKTNSPNGNETQSDESSIIENSSEIEGPDESLGAFRGWSPAIPYGN